jgi:hypothetical protein
MRIVAKTAPMRQMEVGRELRARVKTVLDAAGVAPVGPDTIVITAPSGQGGEAGALPRSGFAARGRGGGGGHVTELTGTEEAVQAEDSIAEPAPDEEGAGPLGEDPERGTP